MDEYSRTVPEIAAPGTSGPYQTRDQRLLELQAAIQGGLYRVPADELATALIRTMLRAN